MARYEIIKTATELGVHDLKEWQIEYIARKTREAAEKAAVEALKLMNEVKDAELASRKASEDPQGQASGREPEGSQAQEAVNAYYNAFAGFPPPGPAVRGGPYSDGEEASRPQAEGGYWDPSWGSPAG